MENHIETNFREIQKILDSCIAHDYKTKVDALFLTSNPQLSSSASFLRLNVLSSLN